MNEPRFYSPVCSIAVAGSVWGAPLWQGLNLGQSPRKGCFPRSSVCIVFHSQQKQGKSHWCFCCSTAVVSLQDVAVLCPRRLPPVLLQRMLGGRS